MIRRLSALALVTLVACLGPFALSIAADAQQPPRRIGVFVGAFPPDGKEAQQFRQGLRDAGYVEGRDVVVEWRATSSEYDPEKFVADLVQSKVDVIVVNGTVATRAAKRATSTIPIVMALVADPVGSGLVVNLAHPGGNVTGLSLMTPELSAKRLQLLKETIPRLTRLAVLWNPTTPWQAEVIQEFKTAAPSLSIELRFAVATTLAQFGSAFSKIRQAHAQALYVVEDGLFFTHRATIIEVGSKARLPVIFPSRQGVEEGALMSYGPNYGDLFRRSAGYVDKILKGAKPGELPVEQPTKFELVVNVKTARTLGLTIPQSILLRADEVIR